MEMMKQHEHVTEKFLPEVKALACIHCGLCLSSCPTYLETGNENDSPRGRILLMRGMSDGVLPVNEVIRRHIDLCLGCRACEAVCPSGVEYGHLLESTRNHLEQAMRRSVAQRLIRRLLVGRILPNRRLTRMALLLPRLLRSMQLDLFLPKRLQNLGTLLPSVIAPDTLPEFSPAVGGPSLGRVAFLRGCVMSSTFADINRSTVDLLTLVGFDVIAPRSITCCGALHTHNGDLDAARQLSRLNTLTLQNLQIDCLVTNAAGCGSTLKEYPDTGTPAGFPTKDLVEILCEPEPFARLSRAIADHGPSAATPDAVVTWHDACHLAHAQRITVEPRRLVRLVAGNRFQEMAESDLCCGSAGSYNITEPEMSHRLAERKAGNIRRRGATTVVTSNAGCMQQISSAFRVTDDIRTIHIADYLHHAIYGAASRR